MPADKGTGLTDARMRALDKRVQGIYSAAYKKALAREKAAIARLAAFDESKYPDLAPEQLRAKRMAYRAAVERETKLTSNIAAEIARGGEEAAKLIKGEMLNVYGLNLDWSRYSTDRQAGVMLNWTVFNKHQLRVLLDDKQAPFTKVAYKNLGNDKIIAGRLQSEMAQAVLLGEGKEKLSKRIQNVTGQSISQARTVAQTERTRVSAQARHMAADEAVDMGLEIDDEWTARMVNTRDTHADLNGQLVPHGDSFVTIAGNKLRYPGDPAAPPEETVRCHCGIIPRVRNVPDSIKQSREKLRKDMGFDEWRDKHYQILAKSAESGIMNYADFASEQRLKRHIADHLGEYPGFTESDYIHRARELLNSPIGGNVLGFEGANGKRYRYDVDANDIAIGSERGAISTLFKPSQKQKYYDRQVKKHGI